MVALATTPKSFAAPVPRRIVTLEWTATEIALSLGIPPVGCAEPSGYRAWVNVENDRLGDVVDVGRRQQPSLEAIRRLQPDLILSSRFRHASLASALGDIAPTHLIDDQAADGDMLAAVYRSVTQAGAALARADEAAALLARFDESMEILKSRLGSTVSGRELIVAQPLPGVPRLRIFAPNSAIAGLLQRIGFTAAMDLPPQPFGFTTIDLEGLAALDGQCTLFILSESIPDDLRNAALWPVLPIVAQGNVMVAGATTWPFGSTASLQKLVGEITSQFD
ncbi:ABC transporter substrate-binding protein [Rhizobium oryzihabitans]|uniref:ABC transporter substrate-binding protein n=1 Tax=Rhizobium oryzihabitans TaxID=2267833 RepID=A0A7L5BQI3_9HYPH|nr:iron-siderophore ABC transporter substrate-binding protein [Agrobacterium tumefaciens]QIB41197.1 ABC transporter substrate-binding protein [Rhizobium oryzihabitans]